MTYRKKFSVLFTAFMILSLSACERSSAENSIEPPSQNTADTKTDRISVHYNNHNSWNLEDTGNFEVQILQYSDSSFHELLLQEYSLEKNESIYLSLSI